LERSFLKTIIVAGILIAAAATIYFFEVPHEKAKKDAEEIKTKILDLNMDKLDRIEIEEKGSKLVLEKVGIDSWRIIQPVHDDADKFAVTSLINSVQFGHVERRINEPNLQLENFGLKDPQLIASFTLNNTKNTLLIGDNAKIGANAYAKLSASPDILLVSGSVLSGLQKKASDLRDKRVFRTDTEIVRLSLSYPNGEQFLLIKIEKKVESPKETSPSPKNENANAGKLSKLKSNKKDDKAKAENEPEPLGPTLKTEWVLINAEGKEIPADSDEGEKLFRALKGLRARGFIDGEDASSPSLGLDEPEAVFEVTFHEKDKDFSVPLILGAKNSDGTLRYVKVGEPGRVLTLDLKDSMDISVTESAIADRRINRLEPETIQKITLNSKEGSYILSRSSDGYDWLVAEKEDEQKTRADWSKASALLNAISKLKYGRELEGREAASARQAINKDERILTALGAADKKLANLRIGPKNEDEKTIYVEDLLTGKVYIVVSEFLKTVGESAKSFAEQASAAALNEESKLPPFAAAPDNVQ